MMLGIASPLKAEPLLMSAPKAFEKLSSGDLIVLDIRTPDEWQETGIAKGALPISMHNRDFLERFQSVLINNAPEKIALICATGGRSADVTYFLKQNGLTGIIDISEGMLGNSSGAGWIARALPIVSANEAIANYEIVQKSWNE